MSIQVELTGDGNFAGAAANVTDYSITEYSSPTTMTDLQSGVGGVTFGVEEDPGFDGSILLPGEPFELTDPYAGTQSGVIDGGSTSGYMLNVSGATALLPLVSQREMPAMSGTLGAVLTAYFASCGITSGFQFDTAIANISVNVPSWVGDVWTQIKKLQAIHQFEVADVAGRIIVRKLRLRSVDVQRYTDTRFNYGRGNASHIVEVYYYNNLWVADKQIFPDPKSFITDRSIITVGAGETTTTNYPVDMWIGTIDAPTQVSSLPWDNTSSTSVYSVVDKDGQPVTITDWRNGGGNLSLAIGPDGKSVDVTVTGMITNQRAPYRIASSSEDREYQYPALYIAATGVQFKKEMIWSGTGADLKDAPADSKTTIDDPMVSTPAEARVVLANAVMRSSGFEQGFEATATSVNRRGDIGQVIYPTFGEYNATIGSQTFATFNTVNAGKTFATQTKEQADLVKLDFVTQAFGGIGGARVRYRDSWYRIRSATSRPGQFDWQSEFDTLFSDWQTVVGPQAQTFATFNTKWAGKSFEQHARMPLAF